MAAITTARRLRRALTLAVAAATALLGSALAAPAPAQADGTAAWIAGKLAGGGAGQAGSMAFGSALSALGLGDTASIKRDLAQIKRQLDTISRQLQGLSAQLSQTGCNVATHQLGDVRALAVDGWERYDALLNRSDPAARVAGLPAMRAFLDSRDFRAARKRVHIALTAPGTGAQTLLQICGQPIERSTHPFVNRVTSARLQTFLEDWQLVEARLSALEVERLTLLGDHAGAREEAESLKRDLAAEDRLLPEIPDDLVLDLRTNLVWRRITPTLTGYEFRADPVKMAHLPTYKQIPTLLKPPCCSAGTPARTVNRAAWLRSAADMEIAPQSSAFWLANPASASEQMIFWLDNSIPTNKKGLQFGWRKRKNSASYIGVRPVRPNERWQLSQAVCYGARSATATATATAEVRRENGVVAGTPLGDAIVERGRALVRSGAGPDVITVGAGSTVASGDCADVVRLTGAGATVRAGAGDDIVRALDGAATVFGGPGSDDLRGGRGDDRIDGGPGGDWVAGGAGDDRLVGGPGRDTLIGGRGDDRIDARDGARDVVVCGPGEDVAIVDRRDETHGCERVLRR